MFIDSPGKPTTLKKWIYLIAATILGLLLSFILRAFIEINYLRSALARGLAVPFYGSGVLPPALNYGLFFFGAIGGFFLGRFWWRLVYVDRIWEKRYKK